MEKPKSIWRIITRMWKNETIWPCLSILLLFYAAIKLLLAILELLGVM